MAANCQAELRGTIYIIALESTRVAGIIFCLSDNATGFMTGHGSGCYSDWHCIPCSPWVQSKRHKCADVMISQAAIMVHVTISEVLDLEADLLLPMRLGDHLNF